MPRANSAVAADLRHIAFPKPTHRVPKLGKSVTICLARILRGEPRASMLAGIDSLLTGPYDPPGAS